MITATKSSDGKIQIIDGYLRLKTVLEHSEQATILLDGKEVMVKYDESGTSLELVK